MRVQQTGKDASVEGRAGWIVSNGARYWPQHREAIIRCDFPHVHWEGQRQCELVPVPDWAADIGVGQPSCLLVDRASIAPGEGPAFERCNWLCAAYLFLSGAQENTQSNASYASLLRGVDARIFDHAWVNRIFLLLRRIAARTAGVPEHGLFGTVPRAAIRLTHDVDAVRKTPEIRFKQTAFRLFTGMRVAVGGQFSAAGRMFGQAVRFVATSPDYWNFAKLKALETERNVRSTFHFYGGPARRASLRQKLLDPGYEVAAPELRQEITSLLDGGWSVGVHPSFESWDDAALMIREREAVETVCGRPVTECRQHWLRFSWTKTWQAQQSAGLRLDSTLGFNDRAGFRNGAALRFKPWDASAERGLDMEAIPMVLMDSHFYDYEPMSAEQRRGALARWIGEIKAVGGEASVNWHVHTLAPDYGWSEGYIDLLDTVT